MTRRQRLAKALDRATDDGTTMLGVVAILAAANFGLLAGMTWLAQQVGLEGWEPLAAIVAVAAVWLAGRTLVRIGREYRAQGQ